MLKRFGDMTVREAGTKILKGLTITMAIFGSMVLLFEMYSCKVGHPLL